MTRFAALGLLLPFVTLAGSGQDAPPPMRFEVRDANGVEVAGAGIYYVHESQVTEWHLQQRGIDTLDWYSKVALLGTAVRTDTKGRFEIPPFEGDILVIAHRDDRFWAENFSNTETPFECGLRQQTPLRVRLTDIGGAPLQGEVALRATDGIESFDLTAGPLSPLDNLVHLFGAAEFEEEVAAGYEMTVVQVGVFRNVPSLAVDLENLPDEPVQLKGLPTGTIELSLFDPAGKPLAGEAEVSIAVVRSGEERGTPPPPLVRVTNTGRVTLPNIGLGLPLEVAVKRPYSERAATYSIEGPKKAGEVVARRIDHKERDVLLVGRLVDEAGAPLVDEYIDVYFKTGNFLTKGEGVITVRSRADGSIQFPLVCRGRDAIQNADVRFVRQVEELHLLLEYRWVTTEVTEAGVVALGDMVMKRP
jgi:hypothetical protein